MWGCYIKSDTPQLKLDCSCEPEWAKDCQVCKGKAVIPLERCPLYYLRQEPMIPHLMQLHSNCENGVYPDKGGLMDQTAQFYTLKSIIDSEIVDLQKDD